MSDQETTRLEAEIETQRDDLARTIDQLAHKLDVKAQAKERAMDLKDRATTDTGKPRPQLLAVGAGVVLLAGVLVWWRRR